MIPVRCPLCSKSFEIASLDELPWFPFCSERCRLIDLGRWLDGDYVVSKAEESDDHDEPPPSEPVPEANGKGE
jgi:endogenous inhibitor of DNA gyrase (YacG/DUF329 family)